MLKLVGVSKLHQSGDIQTPALELLDIPSHGEYGFEGQNVAVLLADEPTGNLDTAHTTVVMVTHSPDHAAQASRTLHLLDGRVMVDALQAA